MYRQSVRQEEAALPITFDSPLKPYKPTSLIDVDIRGNFDRSRDSSAGTSWLGGGKSAAAENGLSYFFATPFLAASRTFCWAIAIL